MRRDPIEDRFDRRVVADVDEGVDARDQHAFLGQVLDSGQYFLDRFRIER